MTAEQNTTESERPLESWKAIAAFLERDPRTVRRWEVHEGLPVHRHQHSSRSSVYAYPSELDAWRRNRRPSSDTTSPDVRRPLALVAGLALAMLASGGGRSAAPLAAAGQTPGFTQRLVVWPENIPRSGVSVSPDGTRVAYAEFESGNVAVADVASGSVRHATEKGSDDDHYSEYVIWSRSGSRLAYSWRDFEQTEIRAVSSNGGEPRVVFHSDAPEEVSVYDWAPDDSWILAGVAGFLPRDNEGDARRIHQRLVRLDVANQAEQVIAEFRGGPVGHTIGNAAISPDGTQVAYDFPLEPHGPRAVFVMSSAGGMARQVTGDHEHGAELLAWLPDGSRVLLQRNGDLLAQAVSEGGAEDAALVSRGVGQVSGLGFTSDGAFYASREAIDNDIYIAELSLRSGQVSGEVRPLAGAPIDGPRNYGTWSPDGARIAYGRPDSTLVVETVATKATRIYAVKLDQINGPAWHPSRQLMVMRGSDRAGRQGLHLLDLNSEQVEYLGPGVGAQFDPDGADLIVWRRGGQIARRSLSTDEEQPLDIPPGRAAISPDGSWMAISAQGQRILRVSAQGGGEPRTLASNVGQVSSIAIEPDGQHVLFSTTRPEHRVYRLAADGTGDPVFTGIELAWIRRLDPHPDGRRIALSSIASSADVFVWEGLPAR